MAKVCLILLVAWSLVAGIIGSEPHSPTVQTEVNTEQEYDAITTPRSSNNDIIRIAWAENIVKPFDYTNHAAIYHLYQYVDLFHIHIHPTLTDLAQGIPMEISIQCSSNPLYSYTAGADTDGFFRYLHISRVHFSSVTLTWEDYDPRSYVGTDLNTIFAHEFTSKNNSIRYVGNRILNIEDERNALNLLFARFEDIRDDSFLLSVMDAQKQKDAVVEEEEQPEDGDEDPERMQLLQEMTQCVDTYTAAAGHLLELVDFISQRFHQFGNDICISKDSSSKKTLLERIAQTNTPEGFEHDIHSSLYHLLIQLYKEKFVFPYLEQSFCNEYKDAAGIHDIKFLGFTKTSYSAVPNAEKNSLLFVVDKLEDKDVPWEECVGFLASIVHVDRDLLQRSVERCETRHRHMFSKPNVTEEEAMEDLDLVNGGGSFSHRQMACLVWKTIRSDNGTTVTPEPTCFPVQDVISNYNTVNLYAAMVTGPDVMIKAQEMSRVDPATSRGTQLLAGKALILGLGGGDLFTVLAQAFPYLQIDNVDISEDIAKTAWKYFGLKYLLCSVTRLNTAKGQLEDLTASFQAAEPLSPLESHLISTDHRLNVLNHEYSSYQQFYEKDFSFNASVSTQMRAGLQPSDFTCRANVILSDAWAFIRWRYELILRQEAAIRKHYRQHNLPFTANMFDKVDYYDYVFLDVYDDISTMWSGDKYQGESNNDVDEAIGHVDILYRVLRPFTGVAIFHVHKDKNFRRYYRHLAEKLGTRQLLSFEVCANDGIFTVSRERLFTLQDLHNQAQTCAAKVTDSGSVTQQCSPSWTEEKRRHDTAVEVVSPHSPHYRAVIHPCDVADKSFLAKESAMLGKRLQLNPRFYYAMLPTLNCYPFAYDAKEEEQEST